jgi:predicted GNAT family N-acyltransferase
LGTFILKYLEEQARQKKLSRIILDAREKAVPFYVKNGYSVDGSSYTLFNVIPHWRMSKNI